MLLFEENSKIKYLFRVYPNGSSFSAAITRFLADDIESLAHLTSASNPMYLHLIGTKIVATIGTDDYVLHEYPAEMSNGKTMTKSSTIQDYSIINVKENSGIELDLQQTKGVSKYITLDLTETQSREESWCTAYCLAAIIRTQTNYTTTARSLMTMALGSEPSANEAFPWGSDSGKTIRRVCIKYGLSPIVLTTTSISTLFQEIMDKSALPYSGHRKCGKPLSCVAGME